MESRSRRADIVGDAMLDRYWYGEVERISPEAPVPVVAVNRSDERPGGAANVARNVRALKANCTLLSVTGDDRDADSLEQLLHTDGISSRVAVSDYPGVLTDRIDDAARELVRRFGRDHDDAACIMARRVP